MSPWLKNAGLPFNDYGLCAMVDGLPSGMGTGVPQKYTNVKDLLHARRLRQPLLKKAARAAS
jgi:hypothetical protein